MQNSIQSAESEAQKKEILLLPNSNINLRVHQHLMEWSSSCRTQAQTQRSQIIRSPPERRHFRADGSLSPSIHPSVRSPPYRHRANIKANRISLAMMAYNPKSTSSLFGHVLKLGLCAFRYCSHWSTAASRSRSSFLMYSMAPASTIALLGFGWPMTPPSSLCGSVGTARRNLSSSELRPSRYFRSTWLCGRRWLCLALAD